MPIPKVKYQHITFNIGALGQEFVIDAETDKLYDTVTGIDIVLGDDNAKFSTLNLSINNVELFPEKFQVLRVRFKEQAPDGYDYHKLEEPAKGSKVSGKYTDKAGGVYPYQVTISLRLENLDNGRPSDK
jgi:hypothetical protein